MTAKAKAGLAGVPDGDDDEDILEDLEADLDVDALGQLLLRGLDQRARIAAKLEGSFVRYRPTERVPACLCADAFGRADEHAVRFNILRKRILAMPEAAFAPMRNGQLERSGAFARGRADVAHLRLGRDGLLTLGASSSSSGHSASASARKRPSPPDPRSDLAHPGGTTTITPDQKTTKISQKQGPSIAPMAGSVTGDGTLREESEDVGNLSGKRRRLVGLGIGKRPVAPSADECRAVAAIANAATAVAELDIGGGGGGAAPEENVHCIWAIGREAGTILRRTAGSSARVPHDTQASQWLRPRRLDLLGMPRATDTGHQTIGSATSSRPDGAPVQD